MSFLRSFAFLLLSGCAELRDMAGFCSALTDRFGDTKITREYSAAAEQRDGCGGGIVRRMSTRTWSRVQPGLPLLLVIAMARLKPLFGGEGVWPSFAACMTAGLAFVAVGLVVGPREPTRFFNRDYLQAHLVWGAAFVVGGGLLWMLRTDAPRYWGSGFVGLGVLYLIVGGVVVWSGRGQAKGMA